MDQWYYSVSGKQTGPVPLNELKHLLASGQLSRDELVWNASMTEWTAARQVPGLTAAPSHTVAPGGSLLSYEAPSMASLQATPRSIELLRQTRPWVRLISVLLFISVAINILIALVVALAGAGSGAPLAGGAALGPVIIACLLYVIPAIFLWEYAGRIAELQMSHRSEDLEHALAAQKSFWKFVGILTTIALCIALLVVLLAFGLAAIAGAR